MQLPFFESGGISDFLILNAQFTNGTTKTYDIKALQKKFPAFKLLDDEVIYDGARVDTGGYGVVHKYGKQWIITRDAMMRELCFFEAFLYLVSFLDMNIPVELSSLPRRWHRRFNS